MTGLLGGPELALAVGVVLALAALAFVLYPIFDGRTGPVLPSTHRPAPDSGAALDSAPAAAIDALREIEFDRATGKLSDADYAALKAAYTSEALAAMRAQSATAAQGTTARPPDIDPAEAAILQYRHRVRACGTCGPRPEPDALYCSSCGRYLEGRCERCGAVVDQPGAQFCAACGHRLAA